MARIALIVAAASALIITAALGFALVPLLRKMHYGQTIKEIGPTWHKNKQGTPTMGGLMFVIGSAAGVFLGWLAVAAQMQDYIGEGAATGGQSIILCLLTAISFGFVGFVDDFIKVVKKRNLGLMARYKIVMQVLITTMFLVSLHLTGNLSTTVVLPLLGSIDFGLFFYPISFLLIIGMVNAVNLTDGVDGLACSVTFLVGIGFMVIAALLGRFTISLFAAAIAGGCAGFLAWNFHPAKVFMGDTGSMFLGGAVVAMAYGMGQPALLLLLGVVYLIEAFSVMLQVCYFKLTHGRRLFKMTPIHHHFELSGWREEKIVAVFSFVTIIGIVLGWLFVYLCL